MPEWNIRELTPGQLSERSGVAVSALHFYEKQGLISSRRTSGNQRRFTRETLRRVAFIRISQKVGIPLASIRQALSELPDERTPTREDWARLSTRWHRELSYSGPGARTLDVDFDDPSSLRGSSNLEN